MFERRVEAAGTGDRPAAGVARHRDLFGADHRPAREDAERRFARCRANGGCCAAAGSGPADGQNDQRGADTMA